MTTLSETGTGNHQTPDEAGVAILQSAIRLLAERGVQGFTTDALASEARVSKTSIYRRWSNKAEILTAVVGLVAGAADVPDAGDLDEEVAAWFVDRQRVYNRPQFRPTVTSLLEVASHNDDVDQVMGNYRRSEQNTLKGILRRAADRGDIDSNWNIDILNQFFLGPLMYRVVLEKQPLDDDTIDQFRRLAMTALRATPPPA